MNMTSTVFIRVYQKQSFDKASFQSWNLIALMRKKRTIQSLGNIQRSILCNPHNGKKRRVLIRSHTAYRPLSDEFVLFISLYIPNSTLYDNIDHIHFLIPQQLFERLISSNLVTLQNLSHNFVPESELDYVNYLKTMLDRSDKPTKPSQTIKSFILVNQISEEKIVEKVVLVFMNVSGSQQNKSQSIEGFQIQMDGRLLQQLVFGTPQLFITAFLPESQQRRLSHLIDVYQKQNKMVNTIRGDGRSLVELSDMLSMEQFYEKKRNQYR